MQALALGTRTLPAAVARGEGAQGQVGQAGEDSGVASEVVSRAVGQGYSVGQAGIAWV